jgi:hypothetical protein
MGGSRMCADIPAVPPVPPTVAAANALATMLAAAQNTTPTQTAAAIQAANLVLLGDATLQSLPQNLAQILRPVVISGTILPQTGQPATTATPLPLPSGTPPTATDLALIAIRTQFGVVQLRTALPLPADGQIFLQLQPGTPPKATLLQASASAAVGDSLHAPPQQQSGLLSPPVLLPSSGSPLATPGITPQPGTILSGVILPQSSLPNLATIGGLTGQAGAANPGQSAGDATGINSPASPQTGNLSGGLPGGLQGLRSVPPSFETAIKGSAPQAFGFGATDGPPPSATFLVLAPDSAGRDEASPDTPSPTAAKAVILGTLRPDETILSLPPNRLLLVPHKLNLPIGSALLLQPYDPIQASVDSVRDFVQAEKEKGWRGLRDIQTAIDATAPNLWQTVAGNLLPHASPRLGGALLFLFAALKADDPDGWIGRGIADTLDGAGRTDLLQKLADDFGAIRQNNLDQNNGAWKSYMLPFLDAGSLTHLPIHIRDDDPKHKRDTATGSTATALRFLVDLTLSRLGFVQLDGLVQPQRLDFILRSEKTLPPSLQRDLSARFSATLEELKRTGSLAFHADTKNWVRFKTKDGAEISV